MPVCAILNKCPKTRLLTQIRHFCWDWEKRSICSHNHIKPIVGSIASTGNLNSYRKPDCHRSRAIAIHLHLRRHIATWCNAPRYQLQPDSQLQHDIAQHSTGMTLWDSKESLFIWQADGSTPLPHHTQLARPQCVKPLSLEKPAILLVNMNV
jgi:hypothetical protein